MLTHVWLDPGHPRAVVRPDPGVRQAAAPRRLRDRHRRGRPLLRARPRHRRRLDPAGEPPAGGRPTPPRRPPERHAAEEDGAAAAAEERRRRRGGGARRERAPAEAEARGGATRPRRWSARSPGSSAGRRHRGRQRRHDGRRLSALHAAGRHDRVAAGARLQHRLRRRRPALHPLLRVPQPLHRVDALLRAVPEHAADDRGLGAGGPLLVRAHRALVGGEAELRRRAQGVPHQPRGRRGPARRR